MTAKEYRYHRLYMDIAQRVALMSHAERKKVGAVAVKNGNIIAYAWNGQPAGFENGCEHDNVTLPTVVHSEINLLGKLAKSTESSEGSSIYLTLSPCTECAKALQSAGVKEVYYDEVYRSTDGLETLKLCNITVVQLSRSIHEQMDRV